MEKNYINIYRLQILQNCYHDASTGAADVVNAAILQFLKDTNY
ncbi:MAG: hypothetical protein RLZZ86_1715 [Cyanobacteriota bacterium]